MKNYTEIELVHSFIKDLSLEVMDPLELLNKRMEFDINISPLGIKSRKLGNNNFEVVSDCKILVNNQDGDKLLALQLEFSGIFKILPENTELKELIYVDCASALYPFIRAEVINLSSKIGMNPIMLPYINFKGQYQKMRSHNNEETL